MLFGLAEGRISVFQGLSIDAPYVPAVQFSWVIRRLDDLDRRTPLVVALASALSRAFVCGQQSSVVTRMAQSGRTCSTILFICKKNLKNTVPYWSIHHLSNFLQSKLFESKKEREIKTECASGLIGWRGGEWQLYGVQSTGHRTELRRTGGSLLLIIHSEWRSDAV